MAQILAFGDSITDGAYDAEGGWANRMQRFFMAQNMRDTSSESHWFYNLGISGNMTEDLLERIEVESFARKVNKPDKKSVFIFAIGTNDSCAKGAPDKYRSSPETFEKNLRQLAKFARQYTDRVIFIGLLPVVEQYVQPFPEVYWYSNDRLKKFNDIVRKVAKETGSVFVEMFEEMKGLPNYKDLLIDGLHPTTKGHQWMYEQIRPKLLEIIG